jgi:hypothetical protein
MEEKYATKEKELLEIDDLLKVSIKNIMKKNAEHIQTLNKKIIFNKISQDRQNVNAK